MNVFLTSDPTFWSYYMRLQQHLQSLHERNRTMNSSQTIICQLGRRREDYVRHTLMNPCAPPRSACPCGKDKVTYVNNAVADLDVEPIPHIKDIQWVPHSSPDIALRFR
jgi:hypothetical protein